MTLHVYYENSCESSSNAVICSFLKIFCVHIFNVGGVKCKCNACESSTCELIQCSGIQCRLNKCKNMKCKWGECKPFNELLLKCDQHVLQLWDWIPCQHPFLPQLPIQTKQLLTPERGKREDSTEAEIEEERARERTTYLLNNHTTIT